MDALAHGGDEGRDKLLVLHGGFGFENRNNFEMHWENAVFYDANGRMVDVQHKGCRGIVPKYDYLHKFCVS